MRFLLTIFLLLGCLSAQGATYANWATTNANPVPPYIGVTGTVLVRTNGNDSTAIKYSTSLPYLTLVAANESAVPGDTIDVGPGLFTGIITNKSGVTYNFNQGSVWSNATPLGLIEMRRGGQVNFTGLGTWKADGVFTTDAVGATNIYGSLSFDSYNSISPGFGMMLQDSMDNNAPQLTNGARIVNLTINGRQAEIGFYSHIYSAGLPTSFGTNCNFDLNVDQLGLYIADEAMTNWTFNVNAKDYVVPTIGGTSARIVVNGGKLIATVPWTHDAVDFGANTLVMNDVLLIGNNLPPTNYIYGSWRTLSDTNYIVKAKQFIGTGHGASLTRFNTISTQTIDADIGVRTMTNYTRIYTGTFFQGSAVNGTITNTIAGDYKIDMALTGVASAIPVNIAVYTNGVITDVGAVLPPISIHAVVAASGIFSLPVNTQITMKLNGDSTDVSAASLVVTKLSD